MFQERWWNSAALLAENCNFGGKPSSQYSTDWQNADVKLLKYVSTAVARLLGTSRGVSQCHFPNKPILRPRLLFALPIDSSAASDIAEDNRTVFSATMSSMTGLDFSSIDVVSSTIEAVTLNAISGILAQAFTAYKAKVTSNSQPGRLTGNSANHPHRICLQSTSRRYFISCCSLPSLRRQTTFSRQYWKSAFLQGLCQTRF